MEVVKLIPVGLITHLITYPGYLTGWKLYNML